MKYLPTDVSSFELMITGNYLYIDKTEQIYNLFKPGQSRYYFLSRPRRFGKSLLISTLKELFRGNKQLFEGLWISKSDYQWKEHSVIHLDFAGISNQSAQALEESLGNNLNRIAASYNIDISEERLLEDKLTLLVEKLAQKNKVVLLVDEYDKPLLDNINDIELAESIREVLGGFYGAFKSLDAHLRAIFITGVTKFSKTSIFSGINNINDISINYRSASLLGYTQDEIVHYFGKDITTLAQEKNKSVEQIYHDIKKWYNGYRFTNMDIKVYNPFSVSYFLHKLSEDNSSPGVALGKNFEVKFGYAGQSSVPPLKRLAAPGVAVLNIKAPYFQGEDWFESGTPSFLIKLLKTQYLTLENLQTTELSPDNLGYFQITRIPLVPLLFQTGYLTIEHFDKESETFNLGFPNFEVENSFKKYLITILSDSSPIEVDDARTRLIKALKTNNLSDFCLVLQSLFAHIPYTLHIRKESYYHSLFQFLMSFLSLDAQSEVLTNRGRLDMTITIQDVMYIFELKINADPTKALEQIYEKKYYEKFLLTNKKIILVGLAFDITENELEIKYVSEEYKQSKS